jgi:hypothetical protein
LRIHLLAESSQIFEAIRSCSARSADQENDCEKCSTHDHLLTVSSRLFVGVVKESRLFTNVLRNWMVQRSHDHDFAAVCDSPRISATTWIGVLGGLSASKGGGGRMT